MQGHIKASKNDQVRAWRAHLVKAAYRARQAKARKELARKSAKAAMWLAALALFVLAATM